MARSFDIIALTGKRDDETVAESLRSLATHLAGRKREVLADPSVAEALEPIGIQPVSVDQICSRADLIVAIGGDGTMLYAAGVVAGSYVPLLGVNRGRLGFLADAQHAYLVLGLPGHGNTGNSCLFPGSLLAGLPGCVGCGRFPGLDLLESWLILTGVRATALLRCGIFPGRLWVAQP
mgnify:CR=1 FL=1